MRVPAAGMWPVFPKWSFFAFSLRFERLIFVGAVPPRADRDAAVCTERSGDAEGSSVPWVHDWDTPECVSRMRTSFWHGQRWIKGCVAAVSLFCRHLAR